MEDLKVLFNENFIMTPEQKKRFKNVIQGKNIFVDLPGTGKTNWEKASKNSNDVKTFNFNGAGPLQIIELQPPVPDLGEINRSLSGQIISSVELTPAAAGKIGDAMMQGLLGLAFSFADGKAAANPLKPAALKTLVSTEMDKIGTLPAYARDPGDVKLVIDVQDGTFVSRVEPASVGAKIRRGLPKAITLPPPLA